LSVGESGDSTGKLHAVEGPALARSTSSTVDVELRELTGDLNRIAPMASAGAMTVVVRSDDVELAAAIRELETAPLRLGNDGRFVPSVPAVLVEAAALLEQHAQATVELVGYAAAESPELSQDRSHALADAVGRYLVGRGVDPSRLTTIGMGDVPLEPLPAEPLMLTVGEADLLVDFEPGSAVLTPDGQRAVDDLASMLILDADLMIKLAVFSYTGGGHDANHDLSHRQGDAIRDVLVAAGMASDHVMVVGRGDAPDFDRGEGATYVSVSEID
jgi:outer membrane protein OmpA-like peptidoglycan-associated protein